MKKISLLILIFASLGFCEITFEDRVNDIVSRVENCKVSNRQKTLAEPLFKDLKKVLLKVTKPEFINESRIVSFGCSRASVRGNFILVQKGNSVILDFIGFDDLQKDALIQFRLVAMDSYDENEKFRTYSDYYYGFYRVFDENDIVTEEYKTSDVYDSFEGLKTMVMDSYKILKEAVK